jgi:hypothetical protein
MINHTHICRACGGNQLRLVRPSTIPSRLTSENFSITDADYGRCAALWRCADCGLLQCPDIEDVLGFYQTLEDQGYEDGRDQRRLQAERLLTHIKDPQGRTPRRQGCRRIQGGMVEGVFTFLDASSVHQLRSRPVWCENCPLSWSHISLFRPTSVLPDEVVSWMC